MNGNVSFREEVLFYYNGWYLIKEIDVLNVMATKHNQLFKIIFNQIK